MLTILATFQYLPLVISNIRAFWNCRSFFRVINVKIARPRVYSVHFSRLRRLTAAVALRNSLIPFRLRQDSVYADLDGRLVITVSAAAFDKRKHAVSLKSIVSPNRNDIMAISP